MKNRNIILLVAGACVLGATAWWTSRDTATAPSPRLGTRLLGAVDINEVDAIELQQGIERVTLIQTDTGWGIKERHGYPANFDAIRRLLLTLDRLNIGQAVRANPQQRKNMGLFPPDVIEILLNVDNKTVQSLSLGAMRQSTRADADPFAFSGTQEGRFVSIEGEPEVYLIDDTLHQASTRLERWIATELVSIDSEKVDRVQIRSSQGEEITFEINDEGDWGFYPDRERSKPNDITLSSLLDSLRHLTLMDVSPRETIQEKLDEGGLREIRIETDDGLFYTCRISQWSNASDERYVLLSVDYQEPTQPDLEEAEMVTFQQAVEAGKAKAAGLNERFAAWAFRIPAFHARALYATMDSFILPMEENEDED